MMLKAVKHQVIAGQLIKLKVVNYSRLRPECSNTASYTEFDSIWNRIAAWTQGSLGRVIAGAFILVGIVGGVAKQSIMSFAIGISAGLGLIYAPGILASLFSADVSFSALSEEVLQHAVAMLQNHGVK